MEFLAIDKREKIAQAIKDCLSSNDPVSVLKKYAHEEGFTPEMINRVVENYNVVNTINFIEQNIGKDRIKSFKVLDKDAVLKDIKRVEKPEVFEKKSSIHIDRKRFYGLLYSDYDFGQVKSAKAKYNRDPDVEWQLRREYEDLDRQILDLQLKLASILEYVKDNYTKEDFEELKKNAASDTDSAALNLLQTLAPINNTKGEKKGGSRSGYAIIQSLVELIHKLLDMLQQKMLIGTKLAEYKLTKKSAQATPVGIIGATAIGSMIGKKWEEWSQAESDVSRLERQLLLQDVQKFEDKIKEAITFKELKEDPIIQNYTDEDIRKAWNLLYRFHPEMVRNPLTAKLVIRKILETGQLETFDVKDLSEIIKNLTSKGAVQ